MFLKEMKSCGSIYGHSDKNLRLSFSCVAIFITAYMLGYSNSDTGLVKLYERLLFYLYRCHFPSVFVSSLLVFFSDSESQSQKSSFPSIPLVFHFLISIMF